MNEKNQKIGKITIPKGAIAQPHELLVAAILSWTGKSVEFVPTSFTRTPDIKFDERFWEIKSPKGSSSRTIENNIRLALKQSDNIIISLDRIKIDETKAIREIKRQAYLTKRIKHLIIITKSKKLIEVK